MSTVAIIAISGMTAGGAVLGAALLAAGIGIGAGYYLFCNRSSTQEEQNTLASQLLNSLNKTKEKIDSMSDADTGEMMSRFVKMEVLTTEIEEAVMNDDRELISEKLVAYQELQHEIDRLIRSAEIDEGEAEAEMRDISVYLSKVSEMAGIPEAFAGTHDILRKKIVSALESPVGNQERALLRALYNDAIEFTKKIDLLQGTGMTGIVEEKVTRTEGKERTLTRDALLADIERFHSSIKKFDAEIHEELAPLVAEARDTRHSQKVQMIKDTLQLRYGKMRDDIARTAVYREALTNLMRELAPYEEANVLLLNMQAMIGKKYIGKEEYTLLMNAGGEFLVREEQKKELASRVKGNLERLGYAVHYETEGKEQRTVMYADTQWDDYKVMLGIGDNNELVSRVVRFVPAGEDGKEATSYEEQKDLEVSTKWCADYDRFLDQLKAEGVDVNIIVRKEPGEEKVVYIPRKEAARAQESFERYRSAKQKGNERS